MKDWILKHPWMTFFLVDAAIVNICKTICILTGHGEEFKETATKTTEESEEA